MSGSALMPVKSDEPRWRHAVSLMGEPKYAADFKHFNYVNADAPKGGTVRLAANGSFDNFNLVVAGVKGQLAAGIGSVYETLLSNSL
ncbi:MAG: ABC transporter substrate-binding protein, partial [Alphaproteobacteria bacterium]|nr:ABC transporter substrate-binding protein [Alphaproteobacteria bacterium]